MCGWTDDLIQLINPDEDRCANRESLNEYRAKWKAGWRPKWFIEEEWTIELEGKQNDNVVQFDRNLILYGPPGTGKTYHSVIYAVAICEGKELDEVKKEPYSDVVNRYRELKEDERIAFTTFHQSYGYEEFIEGIKPKLNSENESLGYTIEDGVFKAFCKRAGAVKVDTSDDHGLKANPHIWGKQLC